VIDINRFAGLSALALAFSCSLASTASAIVVYQNDFESGEIGASSNCTGTDFLLGYTGCLVAAPPDVAGGGSGNFTAYAEPGQTTDNGSPIPGSAASFTTGPLPNLYSGRYEFSFQGSGLRELRFAEGFTPIFVQEDESGNLPDIVSYPFTQSGTALTVDGDSYTVLFDLDVRKQFFGGDGFGDFAQQAFCGVDEPFTQCNFRFTFAISEGGWVDDIELNLLNGDPVSVPEPATGAMLIVGLVAAGSMMRRQSDRKET
jgi:hypothetical protein